MPGPVFIDGENVTLRTVEREDVEFLQELWNDREVRIHGIARPGPFNHERMVEMFEDFVCDHSFTYLLICADGTRVGVITLGPINSTHDNAEYACLVAPEHGGNGYATEASELVIDHAFDQIGLHKVYTTVYDVNDPSLRVMEKLGLTKEGTLRDERFVNGEYVDEHYFGVLADEWPTDE